MIHFQGSIFRYALALTMACLLAMAGTPTALARSSSSTTSSATKATSQVDVNSASLKKLETLPGVSPTLAKKIVSGRPYSSLSDLAHVQGMGQKKANALKHHVTFGAASGATTTRSTKSTKKAHHAKASSASTEPSTVQSPAEPERSSTEPSTTASPTESATPSSTESSSGSKPSASSSKLAPGQTVDINTASEAELDKLPGIGPSKAQAIVDYRNQHGDFKSIEDIQNVHGIKGGTFSKIKDDITVGQ